MLAHVHMHTHTHSLTHRGNNVSMHWECGAADAWNRQIVIGEQEVKDPSNVWISHLSEKKAKNPGESQRRTCFSRFYGERDNKRNTHTWQELCV